MQDDAVWGSALMAGMLATVFGVAAVFWPNITLLTLLYLFSAYVLVDGLVNFFGGISSLSRKGSSWFLQTILGVLEIGVGVYLLRHPHVTFATFILLIGFTLIFRGVFAIVGAFLDQATTTQRTLMVISGLLALVVGIVILFQPVSSGVAFVWLLGLYALIAGPLSISLAFEARKADSKR